MLQASSGTLLAAAVALTRKLAAYAACEGLLPISDAAAAAAAVAAGFVNFGSAAMIGMIAAIVCALVQEGMDRFGKKYVDDTLDVWAVHGVGESHMPHTSCTDSAHKECSAASTVEIRFSLSFGRTIQLPQVIDQLLQLTVLLLG
jgi:ABC-type nickel/cobalt efflux system permease component RcnA